MTSRLERRDLSAVSQWNEYAKDSGIDLVSLLVAGQPAHMQAWTVAPRVKAATEE